MLALDSDSWSTPRHHVAAASVAVACECTRESSLHSHAAQLMVGPVVGDLAACVFDQLSLHEGIVAQLRALAGSGE